MKKGTKILMTVLVAVLVLGIAATAGLFYARDHYILWNGIPLHLQARRLDLKENPLPDVEFFRQFPNLQTLDARDTDITPQEYDALVRTYAGLEILWEVPFRDERIDNRVKKIKLTTLAPEEVRTLTYFTQMTSVDAWQCEDYAALVQLQEAMPECKVFYSVSFAGQEFDCDIEKIVLFDVDGETMVNNLRYLPQVTHVYLTGALPDWEWILEAREVYPDISFDWEVEGLGPVVGPEVEAMTLGPQVREISQLEEALPYLPNLKTLDCRDTDLPGEKLVDLALAYPDIDFLFDLRIGHVTVFTGDEEIDISNHEFQNTRQVERYVNCFPNLKKVVLCECGLPYEELSALDRKYADIRFVWSVDLGGKLFRTDSIYFTPNRTGMKVNDESIYNLRYCTDMICVDIGHMKDVTNCDWAAFMPNLKYLILVQTKVRDLTPLSGLKNLVFLELFQSAVQDYSPLLGCTGLEDLNLSYTYGDPAPIGQMTWLKRLWWNGWWIASVQLPPLLTDTELEFSEVSSTGGTWRQGQHYYDMRDLIGMEYMSG